MTSIEWLIDQLIPEDQHEGIMDIIEDAKDRHKQEIIDAVDLPKEKRWYDAKLYNSSGEQYYQETFGSKGSDEYQTFEKMYDTTSATLCANCGKEKFLHKT